MSRKAPIVTIDFLKEKLEKFGVGVEMEDDDEEFPYSLLKGKTEKDIKKINFDFENYYIGNADANFDKYPDSCQYEGYPCGYETLSNGLAVLFVVAGGDWEHPVCFCLYWDGKEIRGYVPTNGNVYNKKEKCAFGSEENGDATLGDMEEEIDFESMANSDEIRKDVIERIQIV